MGTIKTNYALGYNVLNTLANNLYSINYKGMIQ
jgi:hypothetical protein